MYLKLTIVGSHLCQDTMYAIYKIKDHIKNDRIKVVFNNISTNFPVLKAFLKNRENNPIYDLVKANDKIGIPYFIFEDGTETLDLDEVLEKISTENLH